MKALESSALLAEKLLYLTELISAIDRRLPHVQRAGEPAIANAAVRLRLEAVRRIGEIEQSIADRPSAEARPINT